MISSQKIYEQLVIESIKKRNNLTDESIREIRKLYIRCANNIISKIPKTNGAATRAWLSDYEKYLKSEINSLNNELINLSKNSINESSKLAAEIDGDFFSFINGKYNLDIDKELLDIIYSSDIKIINRIIRGSFYKDNRSLSERIWGYSDKTYNNIREILLEGIVEKNSYKEIAKRLEQYVNPRKRVNSKVGDITKTYGKIENSSLRLIRTTISQVYQAEFISKAKRNPYVEGIKWNLSNAHGSRMPYGDICDEYANQNDYGLGQGVFKKSNVPLQHPNCMCYMTSVITKDLEDIASEINDWIHGASNSKLDKLVA